MFAASLLDPEGEYRDYWGGEYDAQATIPTIEEAQTETDFKRIEAKISQASMFFGALTAFATIYALTRK